MQGSGNGGSVNQLPLFKGVNYHFWSLKMKTLFKSQELWSMVEDGFVDDQPEEPDQALREKRKKDAKALFLIQQALDDAVFPRIAAASTSKEAWSILKQEYLGDKKVIMVRLQSLRREMENARMKDKESVQDYLSRITNIVQQMKSYGEDIKPQQVVSKVMRSLTPRYGQLVCAIEESKDLEIYTFEELKGSLQAYEERGNGETERGEEQAFQAKEEAPREQPFPSSSRGRGRGRGGFRGAHRGRGRGRGHPSNEGRQDYSKGTSKAPIKCYYCNKPGHKEASCWKKEEDKEQGKSEQKSNYAEEEHLFLAQHNSDNVCSSVWYVDSGCSNHMTSSKSLFRDLDDTKKGVVRLGDGKQLAVEGLGTILVPTAQGKTKLLQNVQYVPQLAHNLLSVGQLLCGGYSVVFENGVCTIKERLSNEAVMQILYVKKQGMDEFIIVCLYVDDIIYFSSSQAMLDGFKSAMTKEFEMTDLGKLQYFLGLEIRQNSKGIFLCQKKYAMDLLKRFHMEKCEVAKTPMNTNEKLQKCDGTERADERFYRSMVGGLNYLTHSRPDIALSVSIVSRYMHSPTKQHLGAAKRILKYISGTLEYGIQYSSVREFKLRGYTDSDWAGCVDDRKSTSGSVFDLGSGAITWSSKKQETVALSTSEAEYVAAGAAAKQALWLKKLLSDLCCKQEESPEIWCDSKSAIAMARNPAFHSRTKHIDVQHHFIRQLVTEEKIKLQFCGTDWQNADLFTKALNQAKHYYFMERIGMCKLGSRGGVETDPT
ncbi:unnamed protein product [Cuscuta epithymum]|uniref:CCHC-type domain-containing protein n=1 Tax=Cuscuta epithymum TaxID=186058 RepID=A0AAV0FAQ6_9ASTE|nr:unnamed protein product [Cuscuta epithymum]